MMSKDIKVKDSIKTDNIRVKQSTTLNTVEHSVREMVHEKVKDITEQSRDNSDDNPTTYASSKVEKTLHDAEYQTEKTVIKTKDYAVRKVKDKIQEKKLEQNVQKTETSQTINPSPKLKENTVHTENTVPYQSQIQAQKQNIAIKQRADKSETSSYPSNEHKVDIKTKEVIQEQKTIELHNPDIKEKSEQYVKLKQGTQIKNHSSNIVNQEPTPVENVQKQKQIQEYVKSKQVKTNTEINNANYEENISVIDNPKITEQLNIAELQSEQPTITSIKTKDSVLAEQINNGSSSIKTKESITNSVQTKLKQTDINSVRLRTDEMPYAVKGNVKAKSTSKFNGVIRTKKNELNKPSKMNLKTEKIAKEKLKKQAQKKATKKALENAAKQAVKTAKSTAKTVKVLAQKVAQAVATAVKAVISAISALGGWAVVLILIIIIAIVGAIAASPFGIFFSDENAGTDTNSIPLSSIIGECNVELSSQLDSIEDNTPHDRVVMEGEQANWDEIIAIFAVKTAGAGDETAEDVVVIDEAKKQKLKDLFWEMNSISSRTENMTSGETTETVLYITVNAKTKDDMVNEYHFNAKQKEALDTLLNNNDVIISATHSLAISDATAQDVLRNLSPTLPAKRKAVIKAACSLVGKVNYFWGGKSSAIGWDPSWGRMALVTSEGSRSTGSMRPFGLDCSGFVTWSFINAGFSATQIGHGTQGQIARCTRISWSSAQPGDLAFLSDLSHVGIIAGKDINGNILVIHCSSGANNVVITTNSIFGFAARPSCY